MDKLEVTIARDESRILELVRAEQLDEHRTFRVGIKLEIFVICSNDCIEFPDDLV